MTLRKILLDNLDGGRAGTDRRVVIGCTGEKTGN